YFYRNDNFKKGVNIVLGENKHGKTTFTYLIMYALGISVPAFTDEKSQTLDEVFNDSNNSVIMTVQIDDNIYTFKRKIKENVIRIINNNEVSVLPIDRKNILFNKLNKTFSDWLLEKLNIGLIKVENIFSSEHYLNFDDLFRFSYYDQETNKNQMISDFGTGRNLLKKSPQMKKFIFETLLSY
ncbi:AAA family ATPase, partial [Clostridium botulinum]